MRRDVTFKIVGTIAAPIASLPGTKLAESIDEIKAAKVESNIQVRSFPDL